MAQQQQQAAVLESVWSKDDVLKARGFKDRIFGEDWQPIFTRHQFGVWLLQRKKETRYGKFGIQLQILGEQIGYSYDRMKQCMRFAKMFPDFEMFRAQYPDEAPGWRQVVRELLYDPERDEPSAENASTEPYERWVLNWAQANSEKRAWLYKTAPVICQKLHMTKSEALEEGLILLCEREGHPLPPGLRESIAPSWKY